MNIKEIIQEKIVFYAQNSAQRNVLFHYNEDSEYLPLFVLNKSLNMKPEETFVEHYANKNSMETIKKYYGGIKSLNKDTEIKGAEIRLKKYFGIDPCIYSTQNYYIRKSYLFRYLKSNSSFKSKFSEGEFQVQFQCLIDSEENKILWMYVIRKEYIEYLKYLVLLQKEIPEDVLDKIQLWIRRDFLLDPKYKKLLSGFRKNILNDCLNLGTEVCILEDFSSMYYNLQRPKMKSLKEYKEFLAQKSSDFLCSKREVTPEEIPELIEYFDEGEEEEELEEVNVIDEDEDEDDRPF